MKIDLEEAKQILETHLMDVVEDPFVEYFDEEDSNWPALFIYVGGDYLIDPEDDKTLIAEWGFILKDSGELSFISHSTFGEGQDLPYVVPIDGDFVDVLMAITITLQEMGEYDEE